MRWILIVVVFWNLENFFDWKPEGTSASETEFSETGKRHWTKGRFYSKCNAVSKVLLEMADSCGGPPEFFAVAEVENAFVLRSIVRSVPLRKLEYSTVHFESGDKRGIDCGLMYRKECHKLVYAKPLPIRDDGGSPIRTRDILLAQFISASGDSLAVLVNHHPSKLGGGNSANRKFAMRTLETSMDSLSAVGWTHIIAVGDFNDDVWNGPSVGNLKGRRRTEGTIKFNGSWEKIDGCFSRGLRVEERVCRSPSLMERDKRFGGMKPRRTYIGPRYNGGVSDHLPVVFECRFQNSRSE